MNTIKADALSRYDRNIAEMQRHRDAVELLPDALETLNAFIYATAGNLRVDIPLAATAFRDAYKMLAREWQREAAREYQSDEGSHYFYFTHRASGISLTLCLDAIKSGATCERVQVGTKEVAVYQTICK